MKILIAEDDKMSRTIVSGLIEKLELGQVQIACNGKEVVKMFDSDRFDLILMDGRMPDMDGIDATRAIRLIEKQHQLPRTPIIALTAHAGEQEKERFLDSGMDEFITKPITAKAFKAAIQKVTRGVPPDLASSREEKSSLDLQEAIDLTELSDIMTGNKSLLKKSLHTFVSTYQTQLIKIDKSVENNEYEMLKKNAHRLKGMLKYLAARNGIKLAEQLESMAEEKNTKEADGIVRALKEECLKVIDTIEMVLEGDFFDDSAHFTE